MTRNDRKVLRPNTVTSPPHKRGKRGRYRQLRDAVGLGPVLHDDSFGVEGVCHFVQTAHFSQLSLLLQRVSRITSGKFQIGSTTTSLGVCGEEFGLTVFPQTGQAADRPPDRSFEVAADITNESAARMSTA